MLLFNPLKSLISLLILLSVFATVFSKGHWWNDDFREESDDKVVSNQQQLEYQRLQDTRRRSRNPKSKLNAILIGEVCDPEDPLYNKCTENANCVLFEQENIYKCNCSYSYDSTTSRKCLRSYGAYCDTKDPCNHEAHLSCIDNRCECQNSDVYQSMDGCRSKVGGPCSTSFGPDCIGNAICHSFDIYGRTSRCICNPGYVETADGFCSPGPGMPCNGKGECNMEIPLVCKEGICSCRESVSIYDTEMFSCVGVVGAQCCPNTDGSDCPNSVANGCVTGAYCKKTNKNLPGRCECHLYNLESDERTCEPNPAYGVAVPGKFY